MSFPWTYHGPILAMQVYMATPDEAQTKAALKRVDKQGRDPALGEVIWHELDLKDPRTARASAEKFLEREVKLDVLSMESNIYVFPSLTTPPVNNAALSVNHSIVSRLQ